MGTTEILNQVRGGESELCGALHHLLTHHVNGDRDDDDLDNLLLICRTCHGRIHSPINHGEEWDQLTEQLPQGSLLHAEEDQPMKITSVRLTEQQHEWVQINDLGFGEILRERINEMMAPPGELEAEDAP